MTLNELLTKYETEYLPTVIDQARAKSCIKHLRAINCTVDECNYQTLLHYRANRLQCVGNSTVNRELSTLGSVFTWANESGLTNNRPKFPRAKEASNPECANAIQVQRLIDAAHDLKTKAYIGLMFMTGQRKSAILGLHKSQIQNEVINFNADLGDKSERRKRRGIVPVSKGVKSILDAMREEYGDNEYIFPGGLSSVATMDRAFAVAASKAGLKWITPHVIRHTACTHVLSQGGSIEEASQLLGHSSIKITQQVYTHLKPGYLSKATSALSMAVGL
jgi:integrase